MGSRQLVAVRTSWARALMGRTGPEWGCSRGGGRAANLTSSIAANRLERSME